MWHAVFSGGLVPIWTVILAVGVFAYVSLDGFDLGVGILHGLVPRSDRETVMEAIGPFWDGNETWLILGGVGLLAAFPVAFAIIIPAVYFPIAVMLMALVFRGVAFEFRFKHSGLQRVWDAAFCGGSLVATFAQGVVLGSFIQGFKVDGRIFAGSSFDFATPFTLLTGVALVFGYVLLGAGWLVMKTEADLRDWSRRAGRVALVGVGVCILAVSVWTPLASGVIAHRWFGWPNTLLLLPLPVATIATGLLAWRAFGRAGDWQAFASSVGLFALSFLGIAISLWPMIVPGHYTLWEAASPPATQSFLLVGTLMLLPVILLYTAWSYWVFRGKVVGAAMHAAIPRVG
jgi:cytochrome d ubiquinol oxidase subunit II